LVRREATHQTERLAEGEAMSESLDELKNCVVCGGKLSGGNHHCDEKRIHSIEARRRAHTEKGRVRTPSFSERLSTGFRMLEGQQ
jgi:predicted nucleic acid-binding Zn ribbon protein